MSHHHEDDFRIHAPGFDDLNKKLDRRNFLVKTSLGLGSVAMGSLLGAKMFSGARANPGNTLSPETEMLRRIPHFIPKATRIVYLFMAGGPSQFETFDSKPTLVNLPGQAITHTVTKGQLLTDIKPHQNS